MLLLGCSAGAQTYSEKITKDLTFEKKGLNNVLIIDNINGNVKAEGYEGDRVLIELTRTIIAKSPELLEKGKSIIKLGVIDRTDTLILYTEGLCNNFGRTGKGNGDRDQRGGWGYQWNDRDETCKELVDYKFDYVIKVPQSVSVLVNTVNDGDIQIENVKGVIFANNVNGSIRLSNIVKSAYASTVNGDVDVTYSKNPDKDCRFYTLNGDINAWFQKGLSANMSFESFNGELFTNVPQLESLPVLVERKQTERGTKYKVNGNQFKIGEGGVLLDFETFNGNVYVKEKI
jgi:hypothetical protein